MASATPLSAPLSNGLDGERFAQHYAAAQRDRKLQLKQRVFNFWYYGFAPVALGLLPGTLIADRFFSAAADASLWALVVYGTALCITPAVMIYRRRKHAHKRFQQFYSAALERCIADEEQGRG